MQLKQKSPMWQGCFASNLNSSFKDHFANFRNSVIRLGVPHHYYSAACFAKFGKDLKEIFSSWDIDKNGFCKLNIYYNRCL